ncbi:HEPN domain-containing protein [Yersinia massiliensis]|uniref:RiboL-PSP-HEPN domain-containing protein n=1 Tax=Yersinia massiliensis TaxID=419257 RepID=A0ABM6V0L1_9GAMM|nr:HEPN domain-containing protein [Yersinia massiliensis]AVX40704.1 hypothetical protein DA391_23815 [Yersinia massiliensis]
MSSTKQWFEDEEENRREAWIRARLSDPDLEEDSDEWQELEKEYDNYKDFMEDMAREEYEEQQWLKNNPHTDIYVSSISLLDEILDEGKEHTSETFYKMQIAYCVTIMESCLGDMIKSIVLPNSIYRDNAINNVTELNDVKIKLSDALKGNEPLNKAVQNYLSDLSYHNIPKIYEVYKAVLDYQITSKPILKNIIKLTKLRHDIVHRNGKTREGKEILFEYKDVLDAFNTTKKFLTEMKDMINAAIKYHEEKQMNKDLEN